ncbi:metal-binding protein [Peptostreptococcus russellii]|uniref:Cysteine-rich small domain-containing protein n=1 Tax=Peptostreptococcus russellii TaxID=215200 RepID=A0A1H8HSD4_9FIRM|nr:cysteine-rich small domain-containing protein [Peptostreptococcus russellii]MBC2578511.1 metal-binding protein [Peptostreptococcus russellii]SEN58977.1 Cysteine-rich small domain-containing protein [Peptostreptococcus russellii]
MGDNYKFFSHKNCEFFPCHKVIDEQDFNCLFCYCPLYALGSKCGGNFSYNEKGVKDCSSCILPHKKQNYSYIIKKFNEISEIAKNNR